MLKPSLFFFAALAALLVTGPSMHAEVVTTTLIRVADLPGTDGASPKVPRGGILQVGNDLWFMTADGGSYTLPGAIVTYNLTSHAFTTQYSFGVANPADITTTRYDGFDPAKTTLFQAPNGTMYYSTSFGGQSTTSADGNNGGVIGSFNPATVSSVGVKPLWSGAIVPTTSPNNLTYATPIYIPTATGGYVYFNTYQGGSAGNYGTVQRMTLDTNGDVVLVGGKTSETIIDFIGTNGKQAQGGMLLADGKIYIATSSVAGATAPYTTLNPVLQRIDAQTGAVEILSTNWTTGGASLAYSKPIYDPVRHAIYSVTLGGTAAQGIGGILKWDLQSSGPLAQSFLPNSRDLASGNFADPILFGNSLYYVKQSSGSGDLSGGQIWRYDLETFGLSLVANIKDQLGVASSQSGSLSKVTENGVESLYFLTASDTNLAVGSNNGALFKLAITAAPEPGSLTLLAMGLGLFGMRRKRSLPIT
jgi:uncharacterized repeat protein (TIGR03803 family)